MNYSTMKVFVEQNGRGEGLDIRAEGPVRGLQATDMWAHDGGHWYIQYSNMSLITS